MANGSILDNLLSKPLLKFLAPGSWKSQIVKNGKKIASSVKKVPKFVGLKS